MKNTKKDAIEASKVIKSFIGKNQLSVLNKGCYGSEKQFFIDKLAEMKNIISAMPKTYEQDGMGDNAMVHLHYFNSSMDWYITEKDMEDDQLQAFGLADLGMGSPELGYISITELVDNDVELDVYFDRKTIGEIKGDLNG